MKKNELDNNMISEIFSEMALTSKEESNISGGEGGSYSPKNFPSSYMLVKASFNLQQSSFLGPDICFKVSTLKYMSLGTEN